MLPTQIIAPGTAAASVVFNATECDKVLFVANGVALTATDAVLIAVPNSTNGTTPTYDSTGAVATLKPTLQSIMLEGGFTYVISKGVTAAASGVDVIIKPREGPN